MLEFAGAFILGITLLFGALEAVVKHIDIPRLPTVASRNVSVAPPLPVAVSASEIIEP